MLIVVQVAIDTMRKIQGSALRSQRLPTTVVGKPGPLDAPFCFKENRIGQIALLRKAHQEDLKPELKTNPGQTPLVAKRRLEIF